MRRIEFISMNYNAVYDQQTIFHSKALADDSQSFLLYGQHDATVTVGYNADDRDFVFPVEVLKKEGIEVVRTDRGGKLTLHSPGQMVVYPIFSFAKDITRVKAFIGCLEQTLIDVLNEFEIKAFRRLDHPGVWVEAGGLRPKKIASVGVRIRDKVSLHGFSLNICNDLSLYKWINPCGISGLDMTSMAIIKEVEPSSLEAFYQNVSRKILDTLEIQLSLLF